MNSLEQEMAEERKSAVRYYVTVAVLATGPSDAANAVVAQGVRPGQIVLVRQGLEQEGS